MPIISQNSAQFVLSSFPLPPCSSVVLFKLMAVEHTESLFRSLIAPDYVIFQKVLDLFFTFIFMLSLNPHAAATSSLDCFQYGLIQNS